MGKPEPRFARKPEPEPNPILPRRSCLLSEQRPLILYQTPRRLHCRSLLLVNNRHIAFAHPSITAFSNRALAASQALLTDCAAPRRVVPAQRSQRAPSILPSSAFHTPDFAADDAGFACHNAGWKSWQQPRRSEPNFCFLSKTVVQSCQGYNFKARLCSPAPPPAVSNDLASYTSWSPVLTPPTPSNYLRSSLTATELPYSGLRVGISGVTP